MRVFVAAHDDTPIATARYLTRLQVGAALGGWSADGARDDSGENISARRAYAEVTGLYWMWKNTSDDMLGLCQYRRYFSPVLSPSEAVLTASLPIIQSILDIDTAGQIFAHELGLADLVVPHAVTFPMSLEDQYIDHHRRPQDWYAMLAALWIVQPDDAKEARRFFTQTNRFTHCNMFIGRRDVIDAYCAWVFPILAETERLVVPTDDPSNSRVLGFLAERLFTWWLESRTPRLIRRPILLRT